MSRKCELEGCGMDAEYLDEMDSTYCEECMEIVVSEEGKNYNDFEKIPKELL